jgi:hypothetical protein
MKTTLQTLASGLVCGVLMGLGPILYAFGFIGGQ